MGFPLYERTGDETLRAAGAIEDTTKATRKSILSVAEGAHQDFLMVAYADLYPEKTYRQWLRRIAYPIYLTTRHWATVRRLALEAAHNQCALCGSTHRLEVHHKTYESLGQERLVDLSVLCRKCHSTHHGKPA